jgi:hypothetical protein
MVPARQRLLSGALAIELVWLVLMAAVIVFLAAHLGDGSEEFGSDPATDRALLYVVPPIAAALGLALVGARQALDRSGRAEPTTRISRLALWVTAAGNAGLLATIAASLYHAEASWMVLGGGLLVAVGLITAGCVRAARAIRT